MEGSAYANVTGVLPSYKMGRAGIKRRVSHQLVHRLVIIHFSLFLSTLALRSGPERIRLRLVLRSPMWWSPAIRHDHRVTAALTKPLGIAPSHGRLEKL